MRLLALDPGFERLGIAILEKDAASKEVVLHSECMHTSPKESFSKRLLQIGSHVQEIINTWKPDVCVMETLYFETNKKTAMRVAEARGALIYAIEQASVPLEELHPLTIKVAVTGYGKATKADVMKMVPKLVALPHQSASDDELDAIACGLTYLATYKTIR